MRSLLKIGLAAALFLAIVFWAVGKHNSMRGTYEYQLAKERLRGEFLERAPWVWSAEKPDVYLEETRGLFRWYVEELRGLHARFPSSVDQASYLKDLEAKWAKGQIRESEYEGYKASFEQVQDVWSRIAEGTYAPILTAGDGALRIDFLDATPTLVDGQKALQGRFVLWGAQRTKTEEKVGGGVQTRIQVHASFPDVQVKLRDKRGKAMGELTFGLPFGPYVPLPEQRIPDFPPLGFVGNYAIPLVPYEAEAMEMMASLVSRSTTGTQIRAELVWKEAVPASWKLLEGEAWEGAGIGHREDL